MADHVFIRICNDQMGYNNPHRISQLFRESAEARSTMTPGRQFIYAVMGGVFISIGGLLALILSGGMPGIAANNPGLTKLIFGAAFPVGLIMITIGGAQLFTSDCAVMPFGFLNRSFNFTAVIRVWTNVYAGNLVGALLVSVFTISTDLVSAEPWKAFVVQLAESKMSTSFLKVMLKGVGANVMVCMAVWMSYGAKDVSGKMLAIWFPVMCFVVLGLEHSIANMFFLPTALFFDASFSPMAIIFENILPATIGNILGGLLISCAYYFTLIHPIVGGKPNVSNRDIIDLKTFEQQLN